MRNAVKSKCRRTIVRQWPIIFIYYRPLGPRSDRPFDISESKLLLQLQNIFKNTLNDRFKCLADRLERLLSSSLRVLPANIKVSTISSFSGESSVVSRSLRHSFAATKRVDPPPETDRKALFPFSQHALHHRAPRYVSQMLNCRSYYSQTTDRS
jgi:hypothetical protein